VIRTSTPTIDQYAAAVTVSEESAPPCYAARLLWPYNRLMRRYPQIAPEVIAGFDALDPDERVPIASMLELLKGALALTGDPDIGLKAAREIAPGDYGLIEYMVGSSSNMHEAVELLGRYLPLVNDALEYSFRVVDGRAIIQLDSRVVLPRAAADFQSAAFYVATLQRGHHMVDPEYEAWFVHERPDNLEEYDRTFSPGHVRFGAQFNGFVFDARLLELPFGSPDPQLHAVLRRYAERLLADLPKTETFADKVEQVIQRELRQGEPSVERAAQLLHLTRRTFTRRLEREGTTFTTILDDTRRKLALRYIVERHVGISEIAFLLGFARAGAFFRAFKRWTGTTPTEYRRGHGR
jgi:AraC-like DNA-binding protein